MGLHDSVMATVMESQAPSFVKVFNPIARRILNRGPLLGPNALITVRGRKSGLPRTTPIALVEIDGRRWVIGTFGEVNWVRNLRDVLGPYTRKIPVAPVLLAILGAGDILKDPAAAAAKRPVFELRAA